MESRFQAFDCISNASHTSLLAGRQVLVSPFVHYWSGEGAFWLVCGEFLKIIFLSLIIAAPFIVIRKPPARLGSSGKAMPMGLEKKNSF